ncbi:MAG TPA: hypothetical protein VGN17_03870, partial [Bryobacteraceae bacterium]
GYEGPVRIDDRDADPGLEIGNDHIVHQRCLTNASLSKDGRVFGASRIDLPPFSLPAESMSKEDSRQEIYVSLRTFQSAFFDVQQAVRETHRVLVPGGIAIISIANAYLEGNTFVRGLLPHGSKVVDQDRAHELVNEIRHSLQRLRFDDVGVHSGKAEEYVFGKKRH